MDPNISNYYQRTAEPIRKTKFHLPRLVINKSRVANMNILNSAIIQTQLCGEPKVLTMCNDTTNISEARMGQINILVQCVLSC